MSTVLALVNDAGGAALRSLPRSLTATPRDASPSKAGTEKQRRQAQPRNHRRFWSTEHYALAGVRSYNNNIDIVTVALTLRFNRLSAASGDETAAADYRAQMQIG